MVRVGLTYRSMEPADLDAVTALEQVTYATPWSEQVFRAELAQTDRIYLLAEDDGALAGYAGLMLVGDEAHVTNVAVDDAWRGKRVGTGLMMRLIDGAIHNGASHLTLEVRASNVIAQDLYRRFGMAPVGVRKNYYQNEDALIMWAHDINGPEYGERLSQIREGLNA